MRTFNRNLLRAASWVPAIAAGWRLMGTRLAPEACLDFGGSFDYVAWRCSYTEDHVYAAVPVHHFTSFWLFVTGVIFALAVFIWLRPRRNAA